MSWAYSPLGPVVVDRPGPVRRGLRWWIGVGMPAVVIDGVTKSAANIDPTWIDYDLGSHLRQALKARVVVLNDADAAGLAEMRFGAGVG